MLFNSVIFLVFLTVVLTVYYGLHQKKTAQNFLLLVASYIFYGYWDWRFLFLIALSTVVDFSIGWLLGRTNPSSGSLYRKLLLAVSVATNLSILGFFKYFNFFSENLAEMLALVGLRPGTFTLEVILPVGISFYTFQTLSYTIDIYRGRMKATGNLLDFAVFVAFFPQLVAGPIERAANLLPQIQRPRRVASEQIYAGLYLMLWGYFKKIVIADNAALIADQVFNGYTSFQGLDILLGVFAFAVQIYGDFSGYSDIARGVARLMGFELMLNFLLPYFAKDPADFWRRWHVSLSSWLRDYLYIPLGGNRRGTLSTYRNLFVTMLLGGLWHGAAWNFVLWGGFHGLILILYRLFQKGRVSVKQPGTIHYYLVGFPVAAGKVILMFSLTLVGWLIFRSTSMHQIGYLLSNVSLIPGDQSEVFAVQLAFYVAPLLAVQVLQHIKNDLLVILKLPVVLRVLFYIFLLAWIIIFGVRESTEFIYFQF